MAVMIPEKPIEIPVGSREDEMFLALERLGGDYYVFHSFMILSNVDGIQRESETDFVIFHPHKGIICLEAKAGHVYCSEGTWYYGSGIMMKHGGPYRQADMNKWKLQKYFEEKGMQKEWDKCKVLHAVWFPSISKSELNGISFPADAERSITLTEESLTNIERDVERLFEISLPSKNETALTKEESRRILENILCPSLDLVPSMVSELGIRRKAFNRLLKEQASILNFLEEQPFAIINGAAGTGKTMIALEKARRHSEKGEKVLFLCYNRFLRDFCKNQHYHENVTYNTIDGFACSFCGTETADFSLLKERVEIAYYEGKFPYKHIIIDEGQDFGQEQIEESEIISLLESIALCEDIGGSFYLFYDKNQLVQGRQIPRYISDSDCKLTLYRNCRNTEKIAVTSMRPLGENCKPNLFSGSVPGDSPQIYISEKEDNLKEWIDNSLRYLEGKKIKDVVILTCKTEESSFLSLYCKNGKYKSNGIDYRFTTCRKFKGLEADAIILVDVTTKTFCRPENMNFYVGASRACFFLYIACNMNDEECVQALTVMDPSCSTKRPRKALAAALNALLSSN